MTKIRTGGTSRAVLDAAYVRHGEGGAWLEVDTDYTGATDAGADINAAITSASAFGLAVHLKPGTLRITTPIKPIDKTKLIGAGTRRTILKPVGAVHAIYNTEQGALSPIIDLVISDLEIDGSEQTNPGGGYVATSGKGIFITYMRRATFRNLYIHDTIATGLGIDNLTGVIENVVVNSCGRGNNGNQPGGSGIGIGVGMLNASGEELTISNCHTAVNKRYGIFIENQTAERPTGIKVIGCTARGNKDGIGECGSTGAVIIGNHAWDNTRSGITCDSGTFAPGTPGYFTLVQGNTVWRNQYGVLITNDETGDSIDGIRVFDNLVHANTLDGILVSSLTNPAAGYVCRRVRISRNDCHSNGRNGINCRYTTDDGTVGRTFRRFMVDRNRCWNNGTTGTAGNTAGIRFNCATDDLRVHHNQCWDDGTSTQTVGIQFESAGSMTQTDLSVIGNDLTDCATPLVMPADASLAGTTITRHNRGYNPRGPIARAPGASPWTYTCTKNDEVVYISGGTVTGVTKGGVALGANATGINLEPGESIVVTYSSTPTVAADRK